MISVQGNGSQNKLCFSPSQNFIDLYGFKLKCIEVYQAPRNTRLQRNLTPVVGNNI